MREEINYEIDASLARGSQAKGGSIAIRLLRRGEAIKRPSPGEAQNSLDERAIKELISAHTAYMKEVKGGEMEPSLYRALPHAAIDLLKTLSATGRLLFEGKPLIANFFQPLPLHCTARRMGDALEVASRVELRSRSLALSECGTIGRGPPHWLIVGGLLRLFHEELEWKLIAPLLMGPQKVVGEAALRLLDLIEEAPKEALIVEWQSGESSLSLATPSQEPLPILRLVDPRGAFANLFLDYGGGRELLFQEVRSKVGEITRCHEVEKGWERDLLETGFLPKVTSTAHYYCPLDQVARSLTFLLEIGWKIIDAGGRRVVRHSKESIEVQEAGETLLVRGSLSYEEHEARLEEVVGAFIRRERFLQLSDSLVALLPPRESSPLFEELEEGEVVPGGVKLSRGRFALLPDSIDLGGPLQRTRPSAGLVVADAPPSSLFCGTLRPYQQEGVNWLNSLYEARLHGLLADDMGLGKTVQLLAFLSRLPREGLHLLVVPTSLIFNWRKEIEHFLPSTPVTIHHGEGRVNTSQALATLSGIVLTSYGTLRRDLPLLSSHPFHCIALDEAQEIKNADSQIAGAAYALQGRFRCSMTGTPIENRWEELWSHFRFLLPGHLEGREEFSRNMEAAKVDSRYLERLKRRVRPFFLRRCKEEVATDLPPKSEQVVWVEMEDAERAAYEALLGRSRGRLRELSSSGGKRRMEVLEMILRLRQACCHPLLVAKFLSDEQILESAKYELLMEDLSQLVASGRKALVYSQFTAMLALIKRGCEERGLPFVTLDGSTRNREEVVATFQNDASVPLFLISLSAGGVGLNLTAADAVILYDPWWNVAVENQAIDRAHRIGQTKPVIARRYIVHDSIEEKMMSLKAAKRALSDELFDIDSVPTSFTLEELESLFE